MYFVWYDDSPNKTLKQKLNEASSRYLQKYGHAPTHCLLNAKTGLTEMTGVESLTFETATNVPINYFWLQV